MAIAETNELTFGGVDSTQYGIVIAGFGEYGAPKRATESFYVPGRNGALVIDKGYYENILIEYDVVVQASTQQEFREAVSDYRNAIVSQLGYKRLTDKYHPEEYRLAMYDSGFDENPSFHGSNAVFTLKFNCKPQRFLIDGEDEVEITSGDTITNPTLYDAKPLLYVEGYGGISINDQDITINDIDLGDIVIANESKTYTQQHTYTIDESLLNSGDNIAASFDMICWPKITSTKTGVGTTGKQSAPSNTNSAFSATQSGAQTSISGTIQLLSGTSATFTNTTSGTLKYTYDGAGQSTVNIGYSYTQTVAYDGSANTITITITATFTTSDPILQPESSPGALQIKRFYATAYATTSGLGHPTYIDCELGECWMVRDGQVIPLNNTVELGSDLPVLISGSNEITFENTITGLDVVPRWWQL